MGGTFPAVAGFQDSDFFRDSVNGGEMHFGCGFPPFNIQTNPVPPMVGPLRGQSPVFVLLIFSYCWFF